MTIDGISQMSQMMPMQGIKPPSPTELSDQIMQTQDTDGDEALSITESGLAEETFNTIDTDGDGLVTTEEIVSKITEKMEAMKEKMMSGDMGMMGGGRMPDIQQLNTLLGNNSESDGSDDQTDDFSTLLDVLNNMGTSMSNSPASGSDLYTQIFDQLDMDNQTQNDFFKLLESKSTSVLA